jgi:tryptophan synthase alpha subunit
VADLRTITAPVTPAQALRALAAFFESDDERLPVELLPYLSLIAIARPALDLLQLRIVNRAGLAGILLVDLPTVSDAEGS